METSLLFVIIAIQVVSTAVIVTYLQRIKTMLVPMFQYSALQAMQEAQAILSRSRQTAKEDQDTGPTMH